MMSDTTGSESQVFYERFSKRIQYLSLVSLCLTSIGDGVELYLPSVITQPSSCELGLSPAQENALGLAVYLSTGITIFFVIPLSDRLGRRPLLLSSLYLSIVVTVFCAVVPNYLSLLFSRLLLGVVLAINFSTINVYMSEIAGSERFYVLSIVLGALAHHVGAGWCGVIGYFFLEQIGWRYFIVITSIPFFIVPLILLQFVLPESKSSLKNGEVDEMTCLTSSNIDPIKNNQVPRRLAYIRILKIVSYMFFNFTPWLGTILLVPSVARDSNLKSNQLHLCSSINGAQFLLITVIFGVGHCTGNFVCYLLHGRLKPPNLLSIFSLLSIILYATMLAFSANTLLLFVLMAALQLVAAVPINEVEILATDRTLFGNDYLSLSSGIEMATYCLTAALGNVISEVISYEDALKVFVVFATLGFPAGLSFYIKEK